MNVTLPLDQMTTTEKLSVMESIWKDLSKDPDSYESPDWHREVLAERNARVEEGQEAYQDWDKAKQELRDRLL
tara:strand:+ start:256 stop:474 length:219 start_codon:yes stop_codon:yes gene_type:complete